MMRFPLSSVLAGGAAILAGACLAPAMAQNGQVHVMTVQLPGGGVEQIRYTGDVAPRVVLVPVPVPSMVAMPMMQADPFATLERISAMVDQQATTLLRQVQALRAAPQSVLPGLPPGANGYSFVSTMSGNGVCMHSLRITYNGNGAPKMVSSTSGDCGPSAAQPPSQVTAPEPAIHPMPNTIEAKATGAAPVRQIAWNR
jgi:hypothetical protein